VKARLAALLVLPRTTDMHMQHSYPIFYVDWVIPAAADVLEFSTALLPEAFPC
jgi:hypothetical protein